MCTYCRARSVNRATIRRTSGTSYDRKLTTASKFRSPSVPASDRSSSTSATSDSTAAGSGRPDSLRPRLITVTRIPVAADSATHAVLMIPVPPR